MPRSRNSTRHWLCQHEEHSKPPAEGTGEVIVAFTVTRSKGHIFHMPNHSLHALSSDFSRLFGPFNTDVFNPLLLPERGWKGKNRYCSTSISIPLSHCRHVSQPSKAHSLPTLLITATIKGCAIHHNLTPHAQQANSASRNNSTDVTRIVSAHTSTAFGLVMVSPLPPTGNRCAHLNSSWLSKSDLHTFVFKTDSPTWHEMVRLSLVPHRQVSRQQKSLPPRAIINPLVGSLPAEGKD